MLGSDSSGHWTLQLLCWEQTEGVGCASRKPGGGYFSKWGIGPGSPSSVVAVLSGWKWLVSDAEGETSRTACEVGRKERKCA